MICYNYINRNEKQKIYFSFRFYYFSKVATLAIRRSWRSLPS